MTRILFAISILIIAQSSFCQPNPDSLYAVWKDNTANDTNRLQAVRSYMRITLLFTEPDSCIQIAEQQFQFAKKIGYAMYMADARNTQGIANAIQNKFDLAIDDYMEALKIHEKNGDVKGQASLLNNIGILYSDMGVLDKSIEYYEKSLVKKAEIGDTIGMGSTYNNLGIVYKGLLDYEKALENYFKCLEIETTHSFEEDHSSTYCNIGMVYLHLDSIAKAETYIKEAIRIAEKYDNYHDVSNAYNAMAALEMKRENWSTAKVYAEKSHQLSKEIQSEGIESLSHEYLHIIYKNLGDFENALEHYEWFVFYRDQAQSEANQRAVIQQEYKYSYEKQAAADSIRNEEHKKVQEAQLEAQKAETEKQKQQSYYLYGGLGLTAIFGFFMFNRYRLTQKQKVVIEEQKHQVDQAFVQLEEKNTEILDSINYAKRIQTAILPPESIWKQYLPHSFVLYKPKDIVAGDFYWMEPTDKGVIFAAADCTGHGVPGAMVSVVCNNGLNRSVREFGLKDPGQILDKTREIVIKEFEKSEEEVKDGMDIALCSLYNNELTYAGAHNPLWIIRKDSNEIEEIKANKQPIGQFLESESFTSHKITLNTGDQIFIFSDGYADQFGGDKGKKFKASNFKELLLSIKDLPVNEQKAKLNQTIEDWRGSIEQLDDICVIGVKI